MTKTKNCKLELTQHKCNTELKKHLHGLNWHQGYFLGGSLLSFFGGAQRIKFGSTVKIGFLNCADFTNSSTILGVTQITCWPFQYRIMFILWSVLMMSVWEIDVLLLKKKKCKMNKYKIPIRENFKKNKKLKNLL